MKSEGILRERLLKWQVEKGRPTRQNQPWLPANQEKIITTRSNFKRRPLQEQKNEMSNMTNEICKAGGHDLMGNTLEGPSNVANFANKEVTGVVSKNNSLLGKRPLASKEDCGTSRRTLLEEWKKEKRQKMAQKRVDKPAFVAAGQLDYRRYTMDVLQRPTILKSSTSSLVTATKPHLAVSSTQSGRRLTASVTSTKRHPAASTKPSTSFTRSSRCATSAAMGPPKKPQANMKCVSQPSFKIFDRVSRPTVNPLPKGRSRASAVSIGGTARLQSQSKTALMNRRQTISSALVGATVVPKNPTDQAGVKRGLTGQSGVGPPTSKSIKPAAGMSSNAHGCSTLEPKSSRKSLSSIHRQKTTTSKQLASTVATAKSQLTPTGSLTSQRGNYTALARRQTFGNASSVGKTISTKRVTVAAVAASKLPATSADTNKKSTFNRPQATVPKILPTKKCAAATKAPPLITVKGRTGTPKSIVAKTLAVLPNANHISRPDAACTLSTKPSTSTILNPPFSECTPVSGILKTEGKRKSLRKSVAFKFTHKPIVKWSAALSDNLDAWLAKKKLTPTICRHLHCFGINPSDLNVMNRLSTPTGRENVKSFDTPRNEVRARTRFAGHTPLQQISENASVIREQVNDEKNASNSTPRLLLPSESCTPDAPQSMAQVEQLDEFFTPDSQTPKLLPQLQSRKSLPTSTANLSTLQHAHKDLMNLLHASFPPQEASKWLDEMYMQHPDVQSLAEYWNCRAMVSAACGDVQEAILLLDRGITLDAQPKTKLVEAKEILKGNLAPQRTPKRKQSVDQSNAFKSTLIQYAVIDESAIYRKILDTVAYHNSQLQIRVTPVRRSRRLSRGKIATPIPATPSSEHRRITFCVNTLDEIPKSFRQSIYYVENPNLKNLIDTISPNLSPSDNHKRVLRSAGKKVD